jgi:hypothetical protein
VLGASAGGDVGTFRGEQLTVDVVVVEVVDRRAAGALALGGGRIGVGVAGRGAAQALVEAKRVVSRVTSANRIVNLDLLA